MSIIHMTEDHQNVGEIIVCTHSWISKIFGTSTNNNTGSKVENKHLLQALFEIKTPFLMDGEAKKLSVLLSEDKNENNKRILSNYFDHKVKKTKNETTLPSVEKENVKFIRERFEKIKRSLGFTSHFSYSPTSKDFSLNNQVSRNAADLFLSASDVLLQNVKGNNGETTSVVHEYKGHKYLIPSSCHFVVGDVFKLQSFFQGELFDVIVIDPPWQNKHIWRKRRARGLPHGYKTLYVEEIMKIPLLSVLSADAFVFIWITNNAKMNDEVIDSLHVWDLELLATWFWLKVTQAGDPVVSFDSSLARGKLPYEKLLVTRRKRNQNNDEPNFPDHLQNFIFLGVPSSIHSHKPPLKEILRDVLNVDESKRCLELFARYLTPGWSSLGEEALRLQDLILLQEFDGTIN